MSMEWVLPNFKFCLKKSSSELQVFEDFGSNLVKSYSEILTKRCAATNSRYRLCHSLSSLYTSTKHQQKPQLAMERTPTRHSSKGIASSYKAYTSTVSNKFLITLLTSPHRIIPVNYEIDCNAIRDVQAHSGFQSFEQTDDFNAIRDVQAHSGHHPLWNRQR